ncbi:uncharacterized protein LOC142338669 [Convolutriloba macropyga]|uniref:uncharacterized protein LOC142338669 n=1 Tax=Convolutriloba macropyga TaxID=536237 RepID=UPI003F51BA38
MYYYWDESQYCWEEEHNERALCRDVNNKIQNCNRRMHHCYESETKFVNVSMSMSEDGQLHLSWDQNRPVYSTYLIHRNGLLWSTQREKNLTFTDLRDGETIQILLKTHRGQVDRRTVFVNSGESGNQMAVLVSPNADSVEVTWMPFSPNLAANISKITLEMTIENHTILQSIVPVDEISTRVKELNGAANPDKWVVFGSLIPGVGHTAFLSITGLEGQELYSNRVSFFTEPVQLDVHSNILRLEKDNQNKLTLRGIVTTTTFAEEIVVKTTLHGNGTNFEETRFSIEDCLRNSENGNFELTLPSERFLPGTQVTAEISTSTGLFQTSAVTVHYYEEPVQLDVHSNILRLEKDNQNKLTLRGIVTTTTFAEEIVVKTTLHGNGTNFEETRFSIEDCLRNSENGNFELTLPSERFLPGTQVTAEISTSTGLFQTSAVTVH